MQLNYKRTFFVGLAFLSICSLWQLYDSIIPLILRDTFGIGDGLSGVIMALDNVLALFLLPLFGALSDRAGRRIPFILGGTAAALICLVLLPISDALGSFALFFVILGLLLLSMSTYRSPAVALMPDVTPKPLRSKANAVINLMGAIGGVYSLIMIKVLTPPPNAQGRVDYLPVFLAVAVLMAVCVLILGLTVREKKLVAQMKAINYGMPLEAEPAQEEKGDASRLSPAVRRSLALILASVSLWYMGYNAVTTAFTKYATQQWGHDVGGAATCLLIATVGAVISYIPIGMLSSRFGRKKVILLGVSILAACFAIAAVAAAQFHPALYFMFLLVGFSWAAINVNSYPMVVEISKGGDIGKYTGYYYTFSMAAQVATPILSGMLLEHVGYWTLFPYAAVFVACSFLTMSLTRHGDNRPQPPKSKLEHFDVED